MFKLPTLLLMVLLSGCAVSHSPKAIQIVADPTVLASAMQHVSLLVRIPANPEARTYCIEIDGPGYYSQSCMDVEDPTRSVSITGGFGPTNDGEYVVKAFLYDGGNRELGSSSVKVKVGVQQVDNTGLPPIDPS